VLKAEALLYALGHEKTYPTDLSDAEWACLRARLPDSTVRMRAHALRDIFDAIFYVLRSGCPWRMLLGDFSPWSTVYYHFRRLRLSGLWHRAFAILRAPERKRAGKAPDASAVIVDSQSMKPTEEGAASNGYDAHKNLKGRKRHFLVDTLGLPLSVYVTPADVQDRAGARLLLAGLGLLVPRLKKIWAGGAYSGKELAKWCEEQGGNSKSSNVIGTPRASRSCRSGGSRSGHSRGCAGIGASPRTTSGRCRPPRRSSRCR
jgi:putative transposase